MSWKKFAGPAILAGIALLLLLTININGDMRYVEGDTVDPDFLSSSCCMGLLSILSCLSSIVWFSLALGMRSERAVFLAASTGNSQHSSVPVASSSQSDVVPSAIGGGAASYVREKIAIGKSEGDKARMVGFLLIFGSIAMFALMVLLGFISIIMSFGPGLGFSGGTCDDTCESMWSGAVLIKWISLSLFPCGLIALARPWSWSVEDMRNVSARVALVIVAVIALIAVISFGGPALIVLLVAGMALLIYNHMKDADLRALRLDEVQELVARIYVPLILLSAVALVFEFGFHELFGRFGTYGRFGLGVLALLIIGIFLHLFVSVIVGALVTILSKLSLVGTDGDWGALDLMKFAYSDIFDIFYDEDDDAE